ncbi:hypothetical protein C6P42_003147 [Pichia californica]|nr:hypothetical protein C6P42_003147 [[Candida] californica]
MSPLNLLNKSDNCNISSSSSCGSDSDTIINVKLNPITSSIATKPNISYVDKSRTLSDSSSNNLFSSRGESLSSNDSTSSVSPISSSIKEQLNPQNLKQTIVKKDRASHNKIEKKYRSNINTKFIELKDAVPTLRVLDNNEINFDELEGLAPASRLNKANILSKATEYIRHLESKNNLLLNEIRLLRSNPNYNYHPPNTIPNMPIEVISNLPNQPQMSHIVIPQNDNSYQINYNINDSQPQQPQQQQQQQPQPQRSQNQPRYDQYNTNDNATNPMLTHKSNSIPNFPPDNNYNMNNYSNSIDPKSYCDTNNISNNNDHRNCYGYRSSMNESNNIIDSPPLTVIQNQYSNNQIQPNEYYYQTQQIQNHRRVVPQYYTNQHQQALDPYNDNLISTNNSNNNINNNGNIPLARKIMVAGVATLVGSNMINGSNFNNGNNSNYHSMSASPLLFFVNKSVMFFQLITFISCIYYFVQPLIHDFIKWKKYTEKKNSYRSFYLATFIGFIKMFLDFTPKSKSQLHSSTATNQAPEVFPIDLTSFPTTLTCIVIAYMKILNVSDCSDWKSSNEISLKLANPIEHTFNKIILLDLILKRSPIIGYLLGFKSRITFLVDVLLDLSNNKNKNIDVHSNILSFINCDPNFINSSIVIDQLDSILISLNKTKSSKLTANELYGANSINCGHGYNSVYEYLINTPTNKLNLFELVAVLWSVENVRARLVKFLNDVVNEDDQVDEIIEKDMKVLIMDIQKIESFIPTPCIKLIKCCKIFKSLLDPKNEDSLNDALKMILLSVEENLISIKKNSNEEISESLLNHLRSNKPVLKKVLKVIHFAQNSINSNTSSSSESIQFLSDENRLSLLCSIILHQYAIGNYHYGRSLIKYLKGERTRKFMCSDSISLMASIATFRTLVVVLDNEKRVNENDKIDEIEINSDNISEADVEEDNYDTISIENNQIEDDGDEDYDEEEFNTSQSSSIVEFELFSKESENVSIYSKAESLNCNDRQILEDLLCGLRLYVGQGKVASAEDSADYDILSLHYGLQSELSHRLLELAKELVGYTE